jgi:hypothetical protein
MNELVDCEENFAPGRSPEWLYLLEKRLDMLMKAMNCHCEPISIKAMTHPEIQPIKTS